MPAIPDSLFNIFYFSTVNRREKVHLRESKQNVVTGEVQSNPKTKIAR